MGRPGPHPSRAANAPLRLPARLARRSRGLREPRGCGTCVGRAGWRIPPASPQSKSPPARGPQGSQAARSGILECRDIRHWELPQGRPEKACVTRFTAS
jgi:hypothetical protein